MKETDNYDVTDEAGEMTAIATGIVTGLTLQRTKQPHPQASSSSPLIYCRLAFSIKFQTRYHHISQIVNPSQTRNLDNRIRLINAHKTFPILTNIYGGLLRDRFIHMSLLKLNTVFLDALA